MTAVTDAENCAALWPAGTVTDAGTVTFAPLEESVMLAFAAAAAVRFTVQVAVPAAEKLAGAQLIELKALAAGATNPICAVRVAPLSVAVTVAA